MNSVVNGFEPLHHYLDWRYGVGGLRVPTLLAPDAGQQKTADRPDREKTGPQSRSGIGGFSGWGDALRGTPATYRQMRRMPTLALVRSVVLNALDAGSWTVEADDDAPARAKDVIAKFILPQRAGLIGHGAACSLDHGNAPFEIVPTVRDGLTLAAYTKPLRAGGDGTTIYADRDSGAFAGLRTTTDKVGVGADRPTLTPAECLLFTYDGEPGDLYGRSRMENAREIASKWFEVQNRIGALIDKESGTATLVTVPPDDIANGDAIAMGQAFAQSISTGSGWLAVQSALSALSPEQREAADVEQIIKLLAMKLWGVENVSVGGNATAIAACQAYAAYLDVQAARAYLQPERGVIEGSHGTKAEAADHGDTGTMDCESWERNYVQGCVNPQLVDWVLEQNWGPEAKGKVRVKPNPLRDVQESIDTMLIGNLSTNSATADEFYRTYDVDAVVERRGISKRKTPLPRPEPKPAPAVNGNGRELPVDGGTPRLAASRDMNDDRLDALFSRIVDGRPVLAAARPSGGYSYSSTQIDIPEPHRRDLLSFSAAIPDGEIDPEDGREMSPHVTVKYGLHEETPDGVREAIGDEPPPVLTLGTMGVFPASEKRNSDVLYVSVHSPDLHRLNRKISDAVEHTDTHPGYTPHLTLAYLKPGEGKKYDGGTGFQGRKVRPTELTHSAKSGETTPIPFKG